MTDLGAVTTSRLELRPVRESDVDSLATVFATPEVWHFPYGRGLDRDETEAFVRAQLGQWATVGFGLWVARLRDGGAVVGFIGLSVPTFVPEILPAVEVGWRLDPAHWGHGLATEGARAALREGFEVLGLAEICSLPQSANPASWRVCERLGMRFVREVVCPPTERRFAVNARMYVMERDSHL